jgi:Fe-S-cluster containining protein
MRFAARQRFKCRQCGRCCRMSWSIIVLPHEVEYLRKEGADRLFSRDAGSHGSKAADPFVPIRRRTAILRLGRRSDGSCGFLSSEGRCRIHEKLGMEAKPLICRIFPFNVHSVEGGPVVTASFSCPTVARNLGATLDEQCREIALLADEWRRSFPEKERPLFLEKGRPLNPRTLETLVEILLEALERQGAGDPRPAAARMAAILDDLCRLRVARIAPDRFTEYLELTGRYAVRSGSPAPTRAPSSVDRLLARGFFFAVASLRLRKEWGDGSRLGLGLQMARLLAYMHGLGSPAGDINMSRANEAKWPSRINSLWPIVRNYLSSAITTLGTGRWPVIQEIGVGFAVLNSALLRAAMIATDDALGEEAFIQGLSEAADVLQMSTGLYRSLLGILGGGVGALDGFAGSAK